MTRVSTILKIVNRVLTYCCAGLIGLRYFCARNAAVAGAGRVGVRCNESHPQPADIFSGTVTKLTADSVTAVRKVLGHAAVTRISRDEQTKVEGKLRERHGSRSVIRRAKTMDSWLFTLS